MEYIRNQLHTFQKKHTLLLPIVIFFFGFSFAFGSTDISPIEIMAFFCGLLATIYYIRTQSFRDTFYEPLTYTLIAYGTLVTLSLLFLPLDTHLFSLITLYCITLFFIGRFVVHKRAHDTFLYGYIGAAIFTAGLTMVGAILGDTSTLFHLTSTAGSRGIGFYTDPNVFGAFIVSALIILLGYMLEHWRHNRRLLTVSIFGALLLLICLYYTGSRGAYIQCIVALCIFSCTIKVWKYVPTRIILYAIISLIATSILFILTSDRVQILEPRISLSILPRLHNAVWVFDTLAQRDIHTHVVGIGSGAYESIAPEGFSAHNTYFRLIVEQGMLGLLAFLSIILFWYVRIRPIEKLRFMHHAVFATICGIMVHALFIDTLHFRHFWILLAFL